MAARRSTFAYFSCARLSRSSISPRSKKMFSTSSRASVDVDSIKVSAGGDVESVFGATKTLVETKQWQLCAGGKGLERQFRFKSFRATWVCPILQ